MVSISTSTALSLYDDKLAFLRYEVGILTLKAALSTRTESSPIYSADVKDFQRAPLREALRKELTALEGVYAQGGVTEPVHVEYIDELANRVSHSHGTYLHRGRMRFGVAQKLVNLYLKYLWTASLIEEPPHCPLDGIVRDIADLTYDWTVSDSRQEYEEAISVLAGHARPRSLAVWELQEFRRREQGAA